MASLCKVKGLTKARTAMMLATLLLNGLNGCSHLDPVESAPVELEAWDDRNSGYRFLPGDELDVKLRYHPEFSDRVIVAPDGKIRLVLVGAVKVMNQKPQAVAQDLRERYALELKQPELSVIPRRFASQAIYVGGEVKSPGMHKLVPGMTLLQGVMGSGGVLDTADLDEVIILRRTPQAKSMLRTVSLRDMLEGRSFADDLPLQRFDVVFVPRSGIAEADRISSQYVKKLIPIQMSIYAGYIPNFNGGSSNTFVP